MTELFVEEINETVIEIEGGPTLSTTVDESIQTIVQETVDPVVIDLNSGPRGEPGAAIITGPYPPDTAVGVMGDMYIVTQGSVLVGQVFKKTSPATWTDVGNVRGPAGGVNTVNGYTGPDVVLTQDDIGLDRVDNTNDLEKPVSTATQAALDTKVTKTGNETIAGTKTFTASPFMKPPVLTSDNDHGYIAFRSRDASPNLRTAYVGVPAAGSTDFHISNEMTNGNVVLLANGTGIINTTGSLFENGVRVATVNTAMLLTGNQTIGGLKTFQSGITAPSLNLVQPGNASIEIGRVDGTDSTPHIDFHTSSTSVDYNVRLLASGATAGNGQGTLDIVAGQVSVSGNMTVTGVLNTTGGMAASNLTGTIDNARLNANVMRTDNVQTVAAAKTFTGTVIVPAPTADTHASTKKYVDDAIYILTNGSPALLNTLDELAQALGDDPNFATTMTNALATKEPVIAPGTTADYWRGDKTWQTLNKTVVGLANVDNTSDAAKPISTATQTALDLKAPLASPTFTGVITGNGSGLTTLNGTNISSGTVADARLSTNVATLSGTQTFSGTKTFSVAPAVPDNSFTIAKITSLSTTLANKQALLASPAAVTSSTDWDTLVVTENRPVNSVTGANGPTGAYGYGLLHVFTNGNIVNQIYYPHQTSGAGVVYTRSKYNATDWMPWRAMFDGTQTVLRVVHTGTTWPARPTGATYVEWVGPTAPSAATTNDTWVNTSV